MKPKKAIAAVVFAALGCMSLVACKNKNKNDDGGGPVDPPHDPIISVTAVRPKTTVKITEVETYDYTSLFSITSDGAQVTVLDSYVDHSAVVAEAGLYDVICTYEQESVTAEVEVEATVYSLELKQESVTVLTTKVATTDFKSYFTAKTDGTAVAITADMVTSNVKAEEGDYTYTVTHGDKVKTLKVRVIDDVTIVASYALKELEASKVAGYDYTQLFSLYVDGVAVRVTNAMLDKSAAASAKVGDTFDVKLSYTHTDQVTRTKVAKVKVVADRAYTVSSRNVVTYPHGDTVDLTSLFSIKLGDEDVPVTPDMVEGDVKYTQEGIYTITLHFNNHEYTATVEVKYGVILDYANTDTVIVKKGTDRNTYAFSKDFRLIINGIKFYAIPDDFLQGVEQVDFNTVGEYNVKLHLPYSENPPSLSGGASFTYSDLTIKYVVVDRVGEVKVVDQNVVVPKTQTNYNLFSNLMVTVDGRAQSLTNNPDFVTPITCYAKVLSGDLDYTKSTPQTVRIAVYVYGNDKDPITVEYTAVVRSNVVITPTDKGVFTGETVFTKDLFTVTEDGRPVTVTYDMISGKVDTFTPGIYEITLEYGGASATAVVTVTDDALRGTYKTKMTTISSGNDDDDDYDSDYDVDWGDGDYGYYSIADGFGVSTSAVEASAATWIDDLVIGADSKLTFGNLRGEVLYGINENTLVVRLGSNNFTLYYDNGIIVLDPDNSVKLGFHDAKRPFVFFNESIWEIKETVTINYGSQHVLAGTFSTYSIDTFHIKNKKDNSEKWYGLYIRLAEKTASDTVYVVDWGDAVYADGFEPKSGVQSSVTLNGVTYNFTMSSATAGKVNQTSTTNPYAGKTFLGTVDGVNAQLSASSGNFTLSVNGTTKFSYTMGDLSNYKNSYIDTQNNVLFLYYLYESGREFSYKFHLDTVNNRFTVEDKDVYYGLYMGENEYIFVDGYGTGIVNFTTSKINNFQRTQFRYTVSGGVMYITYIDTSPTFQYGKGAEFYVGEFLNTLTTKSCGAESFAGKTFENVLITDGAIVKLAQYEFAGSRGTRSEQTVKSEILNAISITTKDGELTGARKEAAVDFGNLSCTASGYYLITVSLNVDGAPVMAKYTIQIIMADASYASNPLLITYGAGVLNSRYSLTLDTFGRAVIDCGSVRYIGYAMPDGTDKVFIKVYNGGNYITATAERIANGLISLTAVGTESFTEYFTTGSSRVAGIEGTVIREITVGSEKTYILSAAENAVGRVVTAAFVEGNGANNSVIKITDGGTVKYYRINEWGKTTDGITYLPNYKE
ncbi:MAG: hypothetical protein J1G04_00710 [Clostridiales bacterium]|nr:hypothetical protein [Clostridiales bacterium]